MKKTLATAALALTGLLAVPSSALAGHDGRSESPRESSLDSTFACGRAACGCPTYTKRIFRGRDHCGQPVFSYVQVPFKCAGTCRGVTHRPRDRVYSSFSIWQNRHHQRIDRFRPVISPACGTTPAYTASRRGR